MSAGTHSNGNSFTQDGGSRPSFSYGSGSRAMTAQEEGVDQVVIGANKVQMTDGNGAEAAGLNGLEEGGRVADLTSSSRTTSAHAGLPLSHTNVSTASTTRADDLTNEQHTSASPADSSPNHEDPSYSTSTSSVSLTSDATADTEPHPMNPLNLHLLSHPHRGRGVFAPASIPAGTLIEESPVLVITKEEWDRGRMNDCVLGSYGFCWSNGGMAIGLGLASLFNHSSSPNVNFIRSTSNGTIKFLTSRRVEKGEELCICYIADENKLWFVPADQKQKQKQKQKQGRRRRRKNDHNGGCEDMSESESGPESESAGSSSDSSSDVDLGEAIDVEDLVDQDVLEAQKRRERRLAQARKAGTGLPNGNGRHRMTGRKFAPCCSSSSASSSSAQANVEIQSPRPVRVTKSGSIPPSASASASASRSSTPSTSSTPTPAYPTASTLNSSLPTPLHSESATVATGRRHANRQPAELVEDLDWREEDWVNSKGKEKEQSRAGASWGEVVRVKGPAEREVDEDEREMMEIWIMEFTDPKLTRVALDFSKELSNADDRLKHLKRVCRKKVNDHEVVRIVLHLVSEYDAPTLHRLMTEFSPSLSALQPVRYTVPRLSARTQAQLKWKLHIWPVSYSPAQMIPSSSVHWPVGRKAWVTAGIKRVLSLALDAKRKGEVPVATFVTAFPSAYWPKEDGFIPPTDNLRASSHDTRVSESHPLRHAALNCIASIAHLRTIPPFSDVPPTRNGADYLLTSLTMFISHEPCVMCCMALLHSRVREVFYVFSRKNGGGFEYEPKRVQLDSAPSPSTSTSTSSTGDMPQAGKENGQEGNEVQSENNGHGYGIHARRDLNHRFEAWRWDGEVDEEMRKALEVDEQLQL